MSKFTAVRNIACLLLSIFSIFAVSTHAQTTVFTYQGRFTDSTLPQPTNGNYEMQYKLFDIAAVGTGTQIGTTQTAASVAVVNGIFTVQLDFGESAFRPTLVFIELGARPVGSPAAFTVLGPRQQVTSAPFAIHSKSADRAISSSDADSLGGSPPSNYVQTTDTRLADDRNPLAGSSNYIQNQSASPQTASLNVSGTITGNGGGITNLNAANVATGILPFTRGGTGLNLTGSAGNFMRSNGSAWVSTTLLSTDITGGSGNYIQNSAAQQAASNFNISGTGTVGGAFSANVVNAATQYNLGSTRALYINSSNSFVGTFAGANNTGTSNSYFGANTGSISSGGGNSFFGDNAGFNNTSASNNSFFGADSGKATTIAGSNSFFGTASGLQNTIGTDNSFFGRSAGQANSNGINNSFFGRSAGQANFDGANNSFFGRDSGLANDVGDNNSFFGRDSGKLSHTGSQNSFFGAQAGDGISSGSSNTMVGFNAGGAIAAMAGTTGIGSDSNPQGNLVTVVGYQSGSAAGITNSTAIGANSFVGTSNTLVLGTSSVITEIPGLARVLNLGSAGSTSLCRNAANEISTCTAGNFAEDDASIKSLLAQNKLLMTQIDKQQAQINALKAIVCRGNSGSDICKEETK